MSQSVSIMDAIENDIETQDRLEWSEEDTELLINFYQQAPHLWNTTNKDYSNKQLRIAVLSKLALQLKKTIPQITARFKNLRTIYYRHKKVNAEELKSGSAGGKRKNWIYFKQLSFLSGSEMAPRKSTSSFQVWM